VPAGDRQPAVRVRPRRHGSISRIVVGPGDRWLLRSFNDISHLAITTGPSG